MDPVHQRLVDDVMLLLTAGCNGLDDVVESAAREMVADPGRAWTVICTLTSMNRNAYQAACHDDPDLMAAALGRTRVALERKLAGQ